MNERVGVLICRDNALLLIHRVKNGREYYVIPGGGVEAGESIEDAARREVLEELSLTLELGPILWREENQGRMETYVKAQSVRGEVALGSGPEAAKQSATNRYTPTWVPLTQVASIPLMPESAKSRIVEMVGRREL